MLSYPAYSSGLAPSDYHLLGPLKKSLQGYHYTNDEAQQNAMRKWLPRRGSDFAQKGILLFFKGGRRLVTKMDTN